MYKLVAFALVAAVTCNDLIQGPEGGRKIYDEKITASPAIWKQKNEVTIKTNDTEIIRRIVVTDQRPDKDGEVKIIEGGQGQKNVTVELKSPTILRGYEFHIEVYAAEGLDYPEELYPEVTEELPVMENDTEVNKESATPKESQGSVTGNTTEAKVETTKGENVTDNTNEKEASIITINPIDQFVSENITGVTKTEKNIPLKSDSLLLPSPLDGTKNQESISEGKKTVETVTPMTVAPVPHMTEDFHGLKTNVQGSSTEQSTTETTESVTKRNLKQFENVPKLGEHLVFGIKSA